jgi:PaaX-like protein C-terminal domain
VEDERLDLFVAEQPLIWSTTTVWSPAGVSLQISHSSHTGAPTTNTASVEAWWESIPSKRAAGGPFRWVIFRGEEPRVAVSLPSAIRTWWDLDALRAEHDLFLASAEAIAATPIGTDHEAFVAYVTLIDSWRILPYINPGLPSHLLPDDWPGPAERRPVPRAVQQPARARVDARPVRRRRQGARSRGDDASGCSACPGTGLYSPPRSAPHSPRGRGALMP